MNKIIFQKRIFNIDVKIYLSALLNFIFVIFCAYSITGLIIGLFTLLFLIFMHELGYVLIIKKLKYNVESIDIIFGGGQCNYESVYYEYEDILISWCLKYK